MVKSLQAGRAVAAALVVLFHLGGTFAQDKYFGFKAMDGPFAWADSGVDFFFVLSGFLITVMHRRDFGHPHRLGNYIYKRTLRIYPTYWLVCVAVGLAALAVPSLRQALPADGLQLLAALALLPQDPAVVGGTGSPILFVAWSLQYEMLFYAVIAAAIASRAAGWLAAGALLAAQLACSFGSSCTFPLTFLSSNLIFLFAMGVASAYVATSRWQAPKPVWLACAAMAAFVAFGAFEVVRGRDAVPVDRAFVYGALSSIIIVALAQAETHGKLALEQRWVALLGDASYALYLLHIPIISVLCKIVVSMGVTDRGALVAVFVAIFLACVGASVVFHLTLERRMLAFFARITGRHGKQPIGVGAPSTHRGELG